MKVKYISVLTFMVSFFFCNAFASDNVLPPVNEQTDNEDTRLKEDLKNKLAFERAMAILKAIPPVLKGVAVLMVAGGIVVGVIFFIKFLRNDQIHEAMRGIDDLSERMDGVVETSARLDGLEERVGADTIKIIENQQEEIEKISHINIVLDEHYRDIEIRLSKLETRNIFSKFKKKSSHVSDSNPVSSDDSIHSEGSPDLPK